MDEPKIGVYVCHCGTNIAGVIDVEEVAKYAATLPHVVVSRDYGYMCSDPGQELIKNDIKQLGINRVVVASCSPRLHEKMFQGVLRESGLSPYLFQMANIREHCAWLHEPGPEVTEKAKRMVRAAVNRVSHHEPLEIRQVPIFPATLVIGGGIAGIQATMEIANSNQIVYLVERESSIGGHMAQFDKTFPTLDCAACILTPRMTEVARHPYVRILTYSEVIEVSGYVGNFRVKIRRKPRYVDEEKCIGCGICQEKCPWKVPSEFDMGMRERKAIYTPFPQAVPNIPVIDTEHCAYFLKGKCRACEKFCDAKAINFEQKELTFELDVGNIIIATGFDTLDAAKITQYGYGRYPNVFTSLEFERLCSPTGPTEGH
ncbi:MAG TPA: CoB--CoM heterodisulfide reductase iron-sulfur subunit A family protein, partial [Dehalococcoidia bacterium]|nr:CoB--CoM heterodisulfide reductase iron-sulfur subunit A family protein [Dehalococcoidia bacterium]